MARERHGMCESALMRWPDLTGKGVRLFRPAAYTPRSTAMLQNLTVGQRVQKIPRIFKNLKHHRRVHKIPPLTPQPQPDESSLHTAYFHRIHFNGNIPRTPRSTK
jgi:hypothetical protein